MGDLLKRSAQQIINNEQAILNRETEVPTRLPPPVIKSRPAAFVPPHRSTRRRELIGFEVFEKRALAHEKLTQAMEKHEKAKEMPTRAKKKQRIAADIVDKQATQDFIILTPTI